MRITFHGENHFDFDLSGAMYPIPSLGDGVRLAGCNKGSYRYFVLRTQLMRGYNRVMSYVREAAELLAGYDDIDGRRNGETITKIKYAKEGMMSEIPDRAKLDCYRFIQVSWA